MSTRQLGFMTRRLRPGQDTGQTASAPAAAPAGLRLGGNGPLQTPEPAPVRRLPAVPTAHGEVTLTDDAPVVRLNAYASGIGSLRIAGVQHAAWEATDLATGTIGSTPGPPRPGNRPLVELDGRGLIVGLRDVRALRRLVVTGQDTTITTFTGVKVRNPGLATTSATVIDGRIEIRREPATTDLAGEYRIGLTH